MRRKRLPVDSLLQLRSRLERLPRRSPERKALVASAAQLYGMSAATLYREVQERWPERHARVLFVSGFGETDYHRGALAAARISASTFRPASSRMSPNTTLAPSRANPKAMARPIPWPAPVTIAVFPLSLITSPIRRLHGASDLPYTRFPDRPGTQRLQQSRQVGPCAPWE